MRNYELLAVVRKRLKEQIFLDDYPEVSVELTDIVDLIETERPELKSED